MAALCPVWKLFMDGGLPGLRASSPFGQPETASTPEDFPLAQGGITLLPDWGGGGGQGPAPGTWAPSPSLDWPGTTIWPRLQPLPLT